MKRVVLSMSALAAGFAVLTGCASTSTAGTPSAGSSPRISTAAQLADMVSANASRAGSFHFTTRKVDDFVIASEVGVMTLNSPNQIDDTITGSATFAQSQPDGSSQVIITGGRAYLALPKALLTPGQRPWLLVHANLPAWQGDSTNNLLATYFQDAPQDNDPATLINQLAPAARIASTTTESLNGLPTTHYALTVDLPKVLADLPADSNRKELYKSITGQGLTSTTADIWLNSGGLPVKYSMTLSGHDAITNKTVQYTFVGIYSEWGQPVTVSAPPAGQVGTVTGY